MKSTSILFKKSISIILIFIAGFTFALFLVKTNSYFYALVSPPPTACLASGNMIQDQAEARGMYASFTSMYQPGFVQKGGIIPKNVLCALYVGMTDPNDTKVYYYFGRKNNQNLLMLFSDPAYHTPISNFAYKTLQYCPPECSSALETYLR